MKRIDQFVHTLSYGDAISGEALTIRRVLRDSGIESDIFVVHADYRYEAFARSYETFQEQNESALILHYSIASPLNELFLRTTKPKRAVLYHNLTPERWFQPYNARVVADLVKARSGLKEIVEAADLVVGDSRFNLDELSEFRLQRQSVLPLPFDSEKWRIPSNEGIRRSVKGREGHNILTVGRVAPNKCLTDIIKAFYFYHHKIERKSRLWIVGSDTDTELYSFELRELVEHLNLRTAVEFVGAVADDELRAFYESADLYLCMSEHEGFCVPLIEAMYFGLPIIAFDACAISETLGGAGVLLPRKEPHVTAEVMNLVLSDERLRGELLSVSRAQLSRFSLEAFQKNVMSNIVEPLRVDESNGTRAQSRS